MGTVLKTQGKIAVGTRVDEWARITLDGKTYIVRRHNYGGRDELLYEVYEPLTLERDAYGREGRRRSHARGTFHGDEELGDITWRALPLSLAAVHGQARIDVVEAWVEALRLEAERAVRAAYPADFTDADTDTDTDTQSD